MLQIMFLNRFWDRIAISGAAICCLACQTEVAEDGSAACGDSADFRFYISGTECIDARSILGDESIETMITDATLASYDSDGKLVNVIYYENVGSGVSLYLSGVKENDVYALVNMGDMSKAFPMVEEELDELVYHIGSYEEVFEKGFPMCGVVRDCIYESGKSVQIPLERLLARLDVRILHTQLAGSEVDQNYAYNLCNKSLWLRQANSHLMPFAAGGSRAETVEDMMELSDYNPDLNDRNAYQGHLKPSQMGPGVGYFKDTTIVLYVPENVQGVLLPDNQDPFAKIPDNISGIGGKPYDELCTYLEFNANKPYLGDGFSGDVMYRCYLGADNVSDFSVVRNTRYDMTISLTDEGYHLNSWKVHKGESWTDIRTLCFVDEPYLVYPGTRCNVVLHYNRTSASLNTGSVGNASELTYVFDRDAMASAGITCDFMGVEKVVGKNGYADFYFKVTAASDARTGVSFPISVATVDGVKSDVAVLHVAEIGDLVHEWTFQPRYVSQTGELKISGLIDGLSPLSVTVSDPSIVSCSATDGDSFKVTALRPGDAEIRVSNKDGSQTTVVEVSVAAPKLRVSELSVALNPDGEPAVLDYLYLDENGEPLTNVDEDAYRAYLQPVMTGSDYLSSSSDMASLNMFVSKIYSNGQVLPIGQYDEVKISAPDCPGAGIHNLKIYFVDPFGQMPSVRQGRLDDYTLLSFNDVPSAVREYFKDEISGSGTLRYEVPQVKSNPAFVSASLVPLWKGDFSFENETFRSDYYHDDAESSYGASVTVEKKALSSTAKHSVGKHELLLNVRNRCSGELLSRTVAHVDVYVHSVIGAKASFGNLVCSYPTGGNPASNTVAGIYNYVAGMNVYSPTSSDRIHYMDVSVDFLTDISNVLVFNSMQQGVDSYRNVLNGLDLITPSVLDGQHSSEVRMMYSVCTSGGERVGVCKEPYGPRKGTGAMLYRALAIPAVSMVMPDHQLETLLLGYNVANGAAASPYAPCYEIHDMNLGTDMKKNIVSKYAPFYFSPVSFKSYRDASGKGYHVIHTLEAVAPRTCGWVNLL